MSKYRESIQGLIDWGKQNVEDFSENQISDGYHTFDELYEFRKVYNAALFNEWQKLGVYDVHKSWRHYDGELCFSGGKHKWFIVSAFLPDGLISNHYKADDWDLFQIDEVEAALFPFDGHNGSDVLERLKGLVKN